VIRKKSIKTAGVFQDKNVNIYDSMNFTLMDPGLLKCLERGADWLIINPINADPVYIRDE
jgi:hypothetical protein